LLEHDLFRKPVSTFRDHALTSRDCIFGPDGKILIPGIVTHSANVVEHPELVAWRIKNFASVVGRESVIAGTDCGFSQSYNIVRCHPSVQWAKLESLVEGARMASKELWGR
jgi:5-methyltetrahydropteroyltriglutamate--homocysteine methyltransferase